MDGDRVATLILAAAYDGLLDFRRLDPRDQSWMPTLAAAVNEAARRRRLAVVSAWYQSVLAGIGVYRIKDDSFRDQIDAMKRLRSQLESELHPWDKLNTDDSDKQSEVDRLIANYHKVKALYGQPEDS